MKTITFFFTPVLTLMSAGAKLVTALRANDVTSLRSVMAEHSIDVSKDIPDLGSPLHLVASLGHAACAEARRRLLRTRARTHPHIRECAHSRHGTARSRCTHGSRGTHYTAARIFPNVPKEKSP